MEIYPNYQNIVLHEMPWRKFRLRKPYSSMHLDKMLTQFIRLTVQFWKHAAILQLYAHDRRHSC